MKKVNLEASINKLELQLAAVTGKGPGNSNLWVPGSPEVLQRLKGKIVEFNKKWNYVVIDLGYDSVIYQKIKDKTLPVNAALENGYELVVYRDANNPAEAYVGNIKLSKVDSYCSVANIVEHKKEIKVGDTVFFSDNFINEIRARDKKAYKDALLKAAGGDQDLVDSLTEKESAGITSGNSESDAADDDSKNVNIKENFDYNPTEIKDF